MAKKPPEYRQRIPHEHSGIQINFCKKPGCPNFGMPALINIKRLQLPPIVNKNTGKKHRDNYKVNDDKLICHDCSSEMPMKSNKAIHEEVTRMGDYLVPKPVLVPACPDEACANHSIPVGASKTHYRKEGRQQHTGSQRYVCRACSKAFSINTDPAKGQNKRDINGIIFRLLVNKMPLLRICEVADISMPTLYKKIDFFYEQCRLFAGAQERRLADLRINRLQISVDRQEYMLNWTDTTDKRNSRIHALGSADNRTGFVFGMHLNIDPDAKKTDIEAAAQACGDYEKKPPFREHARYWLEPDFEQSRQRKRKPAGENKKLLDSIDESYEDADLRDDVESFEMMTSTVKLPASGVLLHGEYTMYGHFLFLKKLLPNVEKIRFYMEKESGIRAACLAAFQDDIWRKRCDAFYVKINKEMTIAQKNAAMAKGKRELDEFRGTDTKFEELSDNSLRAFMLEEALDTGAFHLSATYLDKWYIYPAPSKNEPEKAVSWLTDLGDNAYSNFHLAKLMLRASLHGIDRFFMQVRRRISLLERPIKTSSSTGRTWYGYSPYCPDHVVKVLEMLRVYHNYVHATAGVKRRKLKEGEKKRKPGEVKKTFTTPAMRIGLMPAKVSLDEIFGFVRQQPAEDMLGGVK